MWTIALVLREVDFRRIFHPKFSHFNYFFDGIYSLQNHKISHTMASPSNPHSFNHSFAWFCFKNTNSVHFMHEKKSLIFNSFWNNAWDLIYFHDDFVGAENSFPTHFPFPLFRNFYEFEYNLSSYGVKRIKNANEKHIFHFYLNVELENGSLIVAPVLKLLCYVIIVSSYMFMKHFTESFIDVYIDKFCDTTIRFQKSPFPSWPVNDRIYFFLFSFVPYIALRSISW